MRRIKQISPEYKTEAATFEQGADRPLHMRFDERFIYVRAQGLRGWKRLSYGSAYLHAAGIEAGFDPATAHKGRIAR